VVVPKDTCELDAVSVFQVIVAELVVSAEDDTELITGGTAVGVGGGGADGAAEVVNVKFGDIVVPVLFTETAA
jgi:hypothetical protein